MALNTSIARSLVVGVVVIVFGLGTEAQSDARAADQSRSVAMHEDMRPFSNGLRRLPPDVSSNHTIALSGRTLDFAATAGTIKLSDGKGGEVADVAYVAYQLNGAPPESRPVTFVFNGGPGAASVWLQLGALGPWRLSMAAGATFPSASPVLISNDDTWLDFTDLVFVDPPGTGFSQIVAPGEEARKRLWSVDGDIDMLAVVVRRWLVANQRLTSPKFIVGESYGGFRAPRLAKALATEQGVGVSGLVLISPALDFATLGDVNEPFPSAILLPSFAAAQREKAGLVTRDQLADVEQYASGDYVVDYLRGPNDGAAVARMIGRVAALTGLDPQLVARLGGRVDKETFLREFDRKEGRVGANYDATILAYDPAPTANRSRWLDPVLEAADAPLTSAITDLYERQLGWNIDDRYEALNHRVNGAWDWGGDLHAPDSIRPLKEMLALDPNFRVLVTSGLTDLQLPYFGTKLLLDQIPDYGARGRLTFKVYAGGHMHYMRDDSRKLLRNDARTLIVGG
jgi:carboxypeptidase C (cathepsin A)